MMFFRTIISHIFEEYFGFSLFVVDSFNGIYSSLLLLAFTKSNTNSKYMNSLIEWGQWNVKLLIFF